MNNYTDAVKTLSGYPRKVLRPIDRDLLHGIIGMVTEAGELTEAIIKEEFDRPNLIEELGDFRFYFELTALSCGVNIDKVASPEGFECEPGMLADGIEQLTIRSAHLLDLAKKRLFYGKHIMIADLEASLVAIYADYQRLCSLLGVSDKQVQEVNIKKLAQRYPGLKFDADKAINRDIDAERKVLESAS